jgi:UDP-3-O-[3-hydroxymyristoyl] glucosamine N-acyltransferase
LKLGEIATALGLPLEGDPEIDIGGLAGLEDAREGELSFVTGPRYRRAFEGSRASAFLAPLDFDAGGRACLRSAQPYPDFTRAIELLYPEPAPAPEVHPTAVIGDGAELGKDVSVGAYAVIGDGVRIGDRSRIDSITTARSGGTARSTRAPACTRGCAWATVW